MEAVNASNDQDNTIGSPSNVEQGADQAITPDNGHETTQPITRRGLLAPSHLSLGKFHVMMESLIGP